VIKREQGRTYKMQQQKENKRQKKEINTGSK
jgi:hypothetical protein